MTMFNLHNDPDLFRESIRFTSAETKFSQRLIEKDYFCSLLLEYLSRIPELVFKGGTCLAKVHADFYRLSEDLDFTIPLPIDSLKKERQKKIDSTKNSLRNIESSLPAMRVKDPLQGANNSTQYNAILEYTSLMTGTPETIKIEISLREPLIEAVAPYDAQTILLSPVSGNRAYAPMRLPCISLREAYAEKFRAALTRRSPAIRDYFDIDFGVQKMGFQIEDPALVELVRYKISVPGNEKIDVSDDRSKELSKQIDAQLKPVLREKDFANFDLMRAYTIILAMQSKICQ